MGWRECVWGECRIREYADEPSLGQRACRPAFVSAARQPFLDLLVGTVSGPSHGNKHINVQQEARFHSNSSCSFLTFSMLTRGEPGGNSTTWKPLTTRVCKGACSPRRSRSDTALPIATSRLLAYVRTSSKTSSSSESVVLMVTMMPIVRCDVKPLDSASYIYR